MGFLRRALGGNKAPEWASFMTADEYRAFEAAVVHDFKGRGLSVRIQDDGAFVGAGEDELVYGLSNLAQLCHRVERSDWPDVIRAHFEGIAALGPEIDRTMPFEEARSLLRIRVFRVADNDPDLVQKLVKVTLCPDLVAALALDLPTTVRTINSDDVDGWSMPVDELFRIGSSNLASELPTYHRERIEVAEDSSLEMLQGETFFVSSQIYRFGEIVGELANGALVVLPNRHTLMWHVIEGAGVLRAIETLVRGAATFYAKGPGSLTPDLYWWHRGAMTHLPAAIHRDKLNFAPPDSFMELLNSLM